MHYLRQQTVILLLHQETPHDPLSARVVATLAPFLENVGLGRDRSLFGSCTREISTALG